MNKYGFTDKEWKNTLDIFKKYKEIEKVVLFGSRAKNTFKSMSDVDVVVYGDKVNHSLILSLQSDFEDSLIPYFFDILNYKNITSDELNQHIRVYGKTIYDNKIPKGDARLPKGWIETTLGKIAIINPRESIKKGKIATNVPMASLDSFTKTIQNVEKKEFRGGIKFRNGDTLLARITPSLENGKTAYVNILDQNEIGFGSTEYIVIREKKEISDKHFLFYFATSPKFREIAIKLMTGTSGRQRVQTNSLIETKFYFPQLPEQKAIANILTSFDDKIENLQEQNKTLEKIAQTIFKEWFGKYQIGDELPEGWRVGKFGELFDLLMGLSPKGDTYNFDKVGLPLLNGAGDYNNGLLSPNRYTSKPTRINKIGDLIFCIRGTIGNIVFAEKEYCLGRGVAALSPINENDKYFNYLTLGRIIDNLTKNATGSVILGLSKNDINGEEIVIPNRNKLDEFSNIVQGLFNKKEINQQQIQTLKKTRDTLLPKLISGTIRVKEFNENKS